MSTALSIICFAVGMLGVFVGFFLLLPWLVVGARKIDRAYDRYCDYVEGPSR